MQILFHPTQSKIATKAAFSRLATPQERASIAQYVNYCFPGQTHATDKVYFENMNGRTNLLLHPFRFFKAEDAVDADYADAYSAAIRQKKPIHAVTLVYGTSESAMQVEQAGRDYGRQYNPTAQQDRFEYRMLGPTTALIHEVVLPN